MAQSNWKMVQCLVVAAITFFARLADAQQSGWLRHGRFDAANGAIESQVTIDRVVREDVDGDGVEDRLFFLSRVAAGGDGGETACVASLSRGDQWISRIVTTSNEFGIRVLGTFHLGADSFIATTYAQPPSEDQWSASVTRFSTEGRQLVWEGGGPGVAPVRFQLDGDSILIPGEPGPRRRLRWNAARGVMLVENIDADGGVTGAVPTSQESVGSEPVTHPDTGIPTPRQQAASEELPGSINPEGIEACMREIDDCSSLPPPRSWFRVGVAVADPCDALSRGVDIRGPITVLDTDGDGQTERLLTLRLACGNSTALALARHSPEGWILEHPAPASGLAPIGSLERGLSSTTFEWMAPIRIGTRWVIGYRQETNPGIGGEMLHDPLPHTYHYYLFLAPRPRVWNPAFSDHNQGEPWRFERVDDVSIRIWSGQGTSSRLSTLNEERGTFAWRGAWSRPSPSRTHHERRRRHR